MSTLHLVTTLNKLSIVTALYSHEDDIVLLEDCVYLSVQKDDEMRLLEAFGTVHYLENDLQARGLKISASNKIKILKISDLVELTEKHLKSITW